MTQEVRRVMWPVVLAIIIALATPVVVLTIAFRAIHAEDQRQLHRMQDALCGFFVPISGAPVSAQRSPLGRTIVIAGKHGAKVIRCPKP